uniref:Myc box-dependent-interacting protein 1 n=1 Tax=Oreochromis niloticus TaxID=8128 RepID=A0A669B4I6_ORENI
MAEIGKGVTAGKLAINVQKRLTRAQEKVLQKLGKADETRDVVFEEMVANFNKQMAEGTKLQKDLKAYLAAVKTMHDASRRLQDCLADMYEPDWFGKEEMDALAEDTDTLWLDYHQSITDKSLQNMDIYLSQFPDIKARIAKRDRKLVDFDSARHHFTSLQKGKKKDEAKIAKPAALLEMAAPSWAQGLISAHQVAQTNLSYNQAEEDLGRAQKIFEELNVELQDELPALWDRRVGVYVNTFQSLAGHQEKFHKEMSKQEQTATEVEQQYDDDQYQEEAQGGWDYSQSNTQSYSQPGWDEAETAVGEEGWIDDTDHVAQPYTEPNWDNDGANVEQGGWGDDQYTQVELDGLGQVGPQLDAEKFSFTDFICKSDVNGKRLFCFLQVKAVHDYAATDGDELELKMGDVVLVLAFDNPDEQDDGWLMGLKESQWFQKKDISAKGVFPENFTQRV